MERLLRGTVIKSTGSWYNVHLEDGQILECRMAGKIRLGELKATNPIAVGDEVELIIEPENGKGVIKSILPRRNYLVRQSPRRKHDLHLMASNVDQAILIATIINPNLKQGFIDRFLLVTEPYNIPTYIIFNKADVYEEQDLEIFEYLQGIYDPIGYPLMLVSAKTGQGIDELKVLLQDKITMVSGQSGVGKSSMVNALQPQLDLRTSDLSDYSGKGTHTTTFAEMHPLSFGGQIIDTPGIKTLSFIHFEPKDVAHNFREFFELSANCRFGPDCLHRNEPKCAVKAALEAEEISELRYMNYLTILGEIEEQKYWERHKG